MDGPIEGVRRAASRLARREEGEGVISTSIVVLVMALLGAALWVTFSNVFDTTSENIEENVNCVANDTCNSAP